MEEFAIDLRSAAVAVVERTPLSLRERVAAYAELTKPRITLLIVLTSAAGFALASRGAVDYVALFRALLGIALLSSGIATLNQYAERDLDGLMRRTANRPLPAGKLAPWEALAFGAGITILAEIYLLVLVNPLSALLGLDSDRRLRLRLHATENAHDVINTRRCVSRRSAAPDRLDRGARHNQSRRLGSICHSLSLAVSTLSGNRVDVSRRLRPRRHSDAARRRAGRPRHRATDRRLHAHAAAGKFAADRHGNVRTCLLRGSDRARLVVSL